MHSFFNKVIVVLLFLTIVASIGINWYAHVLAAGETNAAGSNVVNTNTLNV